jgi:hypothetical protein
MPDLYPTKTRLALLAAVDAECVMEGIGEHEGIWQLDPDGFVQPIRVTVRIQELYRAGWVDLPDPPVYWRLTDVGRAVLEAGS